MSGFSADWLSLREPVDRRSRNGAILEAIESYFHSRDSITAIDLASGQGSLIRALAERLPARQHWYAVDNEAVLLQATTLATAQSIRIEPRLVDLADSLEKVIALEADLVATSAFIDLVSDPWLDRLIGGLVAKSVPAYFAMSYDGRVACQPPHPLDEAVIAAFGRHQLRDKGFGPALGPGAGAAAADKFAAAGYTVMGERADWHVTPEEAALQTMMVDGWFAAVQEMAEIEFHRLQEWHERRLGWIAAGVARMVVGHVDVWATPPASGRG